MTANQELPKPELERNWISCAEVEARLDAEYYSNDFIQAAARLKRRTPTIPFVESWREYNRIYIGIAGFEKVENASEYTPYLRPTDIGETGRIDYARLPWCKKSWLRDHSKKGCARPEDLIVEVKGNTKRVAVISNRVPANCIVSGSSYRLRVRDGFDVFFAKAFLLSPLGQKLKRRLVSNTTISYIDPDSFRNYQFPSPAPELQRAIGNYLRKSERLSELADDAREALDGWIRQAAAFEQVSSPLGSCLDQSPDDCATDFTWVPNRDLSDRIDPWPHHLAPRMLRAHLENRGSSKHFGEFFDIVSSSRGRLHLKGSVQGEFHLSVLDVDYDGHIDWQAAQKNRYDGPGIKVKPGDILFSCLNPKETRVCPIPEDFVGTIAASPEFAVLNLKEGACTPFLLAAILRSKFVRVQTSFLTRSSSLSRRRLQEDDLMLLVLPWREESVAELNNKLALAVDAQTESDVLLQKSTAAVESLIDGTLNEESLLADSDAIEKWLESHPSPYAAK